MRIAVFSPASSHPRYHRRVQSMLDAGHEVTVYTYTRGYYEVNRYPSGARIIDLGDVENGKYFRRLPKLLHGMRVIRDVERTLPRPDVAYAFGLDAALIMIMSVGKDVITGYEVGDLRSAVVNKALSTWPVRALERWILRHVDVLVVTSPGFVQHHYKHIVADDSEVIIAENRIPARIASMVKRPTERTFAPNGRIRIGVVGLLRYPRTFLPLIDAVKSHPARFELHVHGDGPLAPQFRDAARVASNIYYHGPFRNPDDLGKIYDNLDVSYFVYDNTETNVRLAIPNKLYESMYFGVPGIVAASTTLAERVQQLGVGFVVDPSKGDFVGRWLETVSIDDIKGAAERCLMVPKDELVEDDENLLRALERRAS